MLSTKRFFTISVIAIGLAVPGGCGLETDQPAASGPGYTEAVQLRAESVSKVHEWRTLAEVVRSPQRFGVERLVVGRITDVRPDAGLKVNESPKPGETDGLVIAFDDRAAAWQTLEVDVQVDEVLFGAKDAQPTITIGLVTYPEVSLEAARSDLIGLGRVVVPVIGSVPVFEHNPSLSPVLDDGELIAAIGDDGGLSLPFKGDESKSILADASTLQAVRQLTGESTP